MSWERRMDKHEQKMRFSEKYICDNGVIKISV